MNEKADAKPASVAIRLLDVLDGDVARLEPLARCPRQERSIDARRCVACARMRSISWDPKLGGEVLCAATPEPAPLIARRADLPEIAARVRLHAVATVVTRCITKDTPLPRVRALMADAGITCLPIVDDVMSFVGTITRAALFAAPLEGRAADLPLQRASLPEHASVGSAIALMANDGIDHVAVVTDEGDLVGVWTANDALRWVAERMGYVIRREEEPSSETRLSR